MKKNRRAALFSLCGLATLPGCERRSGGIAEPLPPVPDPPPKPAAELEGAALVPVKVDPALEIRTVTGFRPFRPPGFVVRREERGGKTLIHNYGHGGGGVTLSWGSAHLAVQLAGSIENQECAVVGGGVMGLSTARLLQLRGAKVTLFTQALPPDTVSNVAGAQWWPVSVYDNNRRTEAFSAQFVEAAKFSFRYFQNFPGAGRGVRWVPNYYLSGGPPENGWMGGPGGVLHDLQVGFQDFGPGEHVFPARFVRRFYTMLVEPAIYLPSLLSEFQAAGGSVVITRFETAEEMLRLPQSVIFNCTGLDAARLFEDREMIPIKGQLTCLMPQPEVNYNLISGLYYMFPRSDGIVIGGTYERNQPDPAPNLEARQRILQGVKAVFDGMARIQRESRFGGVTLTG